MIFGVFPSGNVNHRLKNILKKSSNNLNIFGCTAKNNKDTINTQRNATPYTTIKIRYVEIFFKLLRNDIKTSSPPEVETLSKSKTERKINIIHMKTNTLIIFKIKI